MGSINGFSWHVHALLKNRLASLTQRSSWRKAKKTATLLKTLFQSDFCRNYISLIWENLSFLRKLNFAVPLFNLSNTNSFIFQNYHNGEITSTFITLSHRILNFLEILILTSSRGIVHLGTFNKGVVNSKPPIVFQKIFSCKYFVRNILLKKLT